MIRIYDFFWTPQFSDKHNLLGLRPWANPCKSAAAPVTAARKKRIVPSGVWVCSVVWVQFIRELLHSFERQILCFCNGAWIQQMDMLLTLLQYSVPRAEAQELTHLQAIKTAATIFRRLLQFLQETTTQEQQQIILRFIGLRIMVQQMAVQELMQTAGICQALQNFIRFII